MLHYLPPDFDSTEQQRPAHAGIIAIFFLGLDYVLKRINAVHMHIAGGWLVKVPDVISHEDAVQTVIAAPKPTRVNYPPRPVCDDLSYSKALVLEGSRKLVLIPVYDHDNHGQRNLTAAQQIAEQYSTRYQARAPTRGVVFGDLLGGG